MRHISTAAVSLCMAALTGCTNLSPDLQSQVQQALAVACIVDGVLVPIAQPIVAVIGSGGVTVANLDTLLVHPAVVAACSAINGTPAIAAVVSSPATLPAKLPTVDHGSN